MAEYKSKTVVVNRSCMELFNTLTDLQRLAASIPSDKAGEITIEGDTIKVSQSGFIIAIAVTEKLPFSKVVYSDIEAPFHFSVTFNLDEAELITQTSLSIDVSADLNFMMKTLLGGKIKEYLDKAVDAISTGEFIQ